MDVELRTPRLLLRQPRPGDAPRIARFLNNFRVTGNLARVPYPYTEADAVAWLRTWRPDLPPGQTGFSLDLPGEGVWPIVLCSYGVVPKDLKGKPNGAAILSFFKYALTEGAEISLKRGGEPMPTAQRTRVMGVLEKFMA